MTEDAVHPFYSEVPRDLSHAVAIGGALISMVEPHMGHEYEYNRWYEDDHFYAGATAMPWIQAGRRFVATRDLQLLRYPEDSFIAQPVTAGCYLHLYWITSEHVEDHEAWTRNTNVELTKQGRRVEERDHVFTAFQGYRGATYRDNRGPRDIHALDYPYPGLVFEVIDAHPGVTRDTLEDWVHGSYLPWVQRDAGSAVAQSLMFVMRGVDGSVASTGTGEEAGTAMPGGGDATITRPQRGFAIPYPERRITICHFLDDDPRADWDRQFARNGDRVAASGLGRLELCAPFVPVLHGTDRYVDELR
jgi:hypothetical protein